MQTILFNSPPKTPKKFASKRPQSLANSYQKKPPRHYLSNAQTMVKKALHGTRNPVAPQEIGFFPSVQGRNLLGSNGKTFKVKVVENKTEDRSHATFHMRELPRRPALMTNQKIQGLINDMMAHSPTSTRTGHYRSSSHSMRMTPAQPRRIKTRTTMQLSQVVKTKEITEEKTEPPKVVTPSPAP